MLLANVFRNQPENKLWEWCYADRALRSPYFQVAAGRLVLIIPQSND
jgi:hypothetical protein